MREFKVLLVVGDPISPELDMTSEISTQHFIEMRPYSIWSNLDINRSRGVLLALRNAATFWEDGKIVNVAGPGQ